MENKNFESSPGAASEELNFWVREPESDAFNKSLVAARLCSCDSVCLAVIEDDIGDMGY